jgi:hypothetical protein
MAYQVHHMWHPSHKVTNLVEAVKFSKKVFGRDSIPVESCLPPIESAPNYPRDYGSFTIIQDVSFDSIQPRKYVVEGRQTYEDVDSPGHLNCFGWAVTGGR